MKTTLLSLALFSILGNVALSQDFTYSEQLIDKIDRIKQSNQLLNINGISPRRSITPYLIEAKNNWEILSPAAQNYFKNMAARPQLSGTEEIYYSSYFDFHYTISGVDAVDPTDNNTDGVPDYIEDMATVADYVYLTDSVRGYTMPPADSGAGGSDIYDIYVLDIGSGTYGYVSPEINIGDNPNSTGVTEFSAITSFMAMRHNYSGFGGSQLDNIKVTLAHEFCHAIDFGYSSDLSTFFMEAKGAWEEQLIYPSITDNYQYLTEISNSPDIALNWNYSDGNGGEPYSWHWYGCWIFLKYITDHTNDEIIIELLKRGITNPNLISCIDEELVANWNSDFTTMFGNWLIANILMDSNPLYDPYTYTNASAYSTYLSNNGDFYLEDNLTYTGTTIIWASNTDGNGRLMRLSADYISINPNQNFSIIVTFNNSSADVGVVLLKANGTTGALSIQQPIGSGTDLVIDVTDQANFDNYMLLIGRWDETVADTMSEQYTLIITSIPAGIDAIGNNILIKAHPNPTTGLLTITGVEGIASIYDVYGRVVLTSNSNKLDISSAADGIYFVRLVDEQGKVYVCKVLKE